MKDARICDEELLRKLDSAASPEVSGMLNRYFVAALCESAAARLRFKDAAIDNLAAEVQRLREWEAFAAHEIATLKSSLQYLREERRWIPVEEDLPEPDAPVFCHAYGSTWIGCRSSDEDGECWCGLLELPWYHKKGHWVVDPEFGGYQPTHWYPFPQPLPQPPEKQ